MTSISLTPLLKVEDLAVEFGPKDSPIRVVNGVSFEIEAGGSVGIVGESGSGKSITSLAIMGLIPNPPGRIAQGRIELEGVNLLDLPKTKLPEIRGRDIAMIFQEPMSSLNPVMTIGDQIGEAIKLHEKMSREQRRARIIELLKLVGIPNPEGRLDAYPHQFSGGMRQRVMIAMAVACNPKLLIADEPTTALDVTIQAQVLDLMARVRKTLNTAVLLISHDLGVIAEVCDRVIVMYAGRVVEDADVRSIFANPSHPYTQGLLKSIPRLDDDQKRLYQIPGSVPTAGSVKQGCPFYARCPLHIDRCRSEMPPMFSFGPRHKAACWVTAGATA
ncbi:oligopeptide/dipeptide ABC transporter ATP-binding protein [Rhizobium sp. BK529]|uniref:ABC transporter ATP-binding protein n=1 Tax=unclassified Rhizobium TaxID=2613769 RepID=UPI00104A3192|nr:MULTISPECIES: ABC transporter ATP-binding protein [unclassified Rhizobium]MBB3593425.1 oligopeptide/dipeptide ABC transporter ATP-binding protein [Rhizobium sp. BK529]TCS03221.1 peptide/nickel transport system ATP-binding protein/oligopeptide transport system ATP-binding protein [Rhizobium sp. BK418]